MSFACRGITHCDECGTTLRRNEFAICDMCRERAKEKNKHTASVNKEKVSKTYKGHELIKAIVDGEIKENTRYRKMERLRWRTNTSSNKRWKGVFVIYE